MSVKAKLLIIGHSQHGKTTVGSILIRRGYTLVDSSKYAAEAFMFDKLKGKYGYRSVQECHDDRVNHREEWYQGIHEYNAGDLARLVREVLAESDCYAGLRHPKEYAAARHLFDHIIWVDACQRLPKEPAASMGLKPTQATYHLCNNGSEADLPVNVDVMMQRLGLEKPPEQPSQPAEKLLEVPEQEIRTEYPRKPKRPKKRTGLKSFFQPG